MLYVAEGEPKVSDGKHELIANRYTAAVEAASHRRFVRFTAQRPDAFRYSCLHGSNTGR